MSKIKQFLADFFDLRFFGYVLIFAPFTILGETELFEWKWFVQLLCVVIASKLFIEYGKKQNDLKQ